MGLGTAQGTVTTGANFIPELWIDEIRSFLEAKLVMGNLVKKFSIMGKAGDTIHVPDLSELAANDKAANTEVTLQAPTETKFDLSIDKHKESSFVIEDMLETQSAYDLRSEYTRSAGYAIAKQIDSDLIALGSGLSNAVIGSDGLTAWNASGTGNGADLTDAGIRRAIEILDTADVPEESRYLIIHPTQKNVLLGIARFTEQAFYGSGSAISTGEFGEIYGVKVYVSTQVPAVTAGDGSTVYHRNLLFQKDCFVLGQQTAPRVQGNYIPQHLGTLVTVDTIYGVGEFRDANGVAMYSPAA